MSMEKEKTPERCKGCVYWKPLSGGSNGKACHHYLETGQRRVKDGEKCLSRTTQRQKKAKLTGDGWVKQ